MRKMQNLEKLRRRAGLTPDYMARALEIDEEKYLGYEQGTCELSLDMLCHIANTFYISTDILLDRAVLPEGWMDEYLSE